MRLVIRAMILLPAAEPIADTMAPLPLLDLKAAEILERKVVIPPQGDPLFPALDSGLGGIAIGGISVTSEPSKRFAHSAPTMSAGR